MERVVFQQDSPILKYTVYLATRGGYDDLVMKGGDWYVKIRKPVWIGRIVPGVKINDEEEKFLNEHGSIVFVAHGKGKQGCGIATFYKSSRELERKWREIVRFFNDLDD